MSRDDHRDVRERWECPKHVGWTRSYKRWWDFSIGQPITLTRRPLPRGRYCRHLHLCWSNQQWRDEYLSVYGQDMWVMSFQTSAFHVRNVPIWRPSFIRWILQLNGCLLLLLKCCRSNFFRIAVYYWHDAQISTLCIFNSAFLQRKHRMLKLSLHF